MHKHTRLTPTLRRDLYDCWQKGSVSFRELGRRYHVDKNIVKVVILRGKLGDFSVHDSTNHRYRTIEYGLKRLALIEKETREKHTKREKRNKRYERISPGELVHGDTKRFPNIYRKDYFRKVLIKAPVLYVLIDDYTRFLMADILPDRTMWSSSTFLEVMSLRSPFQIECHYSDNGGEYKGNKTHAFVSACNRLGIEQRFTKPYHPWTNGKAERVIKTITHEWFIPNRDQFQSIEEMQKSLYEYVDWYNHQRKHQSINNLTPSQRLVEFYGRSGDNA
jgi:transposase InsO family protein